MLFNLLDFGSGAQATHYFVFCFVAVIGTLQGVATRYGLKELLWFDGRAGYFFATLTIPGSFVWFFLTDQDIFIPGLAGGELFAVFVAAFMAAVPMTRFVSALILRVRTLTVRAPGQEREEEPTL